MTDLNISEQPEQRGCPTNGGPVADRGAAANPSAFIEQDETGYSRLELLVRGAKCAGCISKIEGGVLSLEGVETARLNLSTGKLSTAWKGGAELAGQIAGKVADLGYQVSPYDPGEAEVERSREGRFLLLCMAVAGFAMMNIMLLSVSVWSGFTGEMNESTRALMHWFSALIALPAAIFAGQPFFRSAFRSLSKGKANMDVPISLAVILALGISLYETINGGLHAYFDAAVMLLFFLLIGRWLDHTLRGATREAARQLLSMQSVTANIMAMDGNITAVRSQDVKPGDQLVLWPGDRTPVDGIVTDGQSDIDTALVSGESAPAFITESGQIRAGMVNLTSRLVMKATATSSDSLLAELTRLVEAGETAKGHFVRLADRAAQLYVPLVHTLAVLAFTGWMLAGAGVHKSILIASAVLIITCPCALGLAAPAVQIVAVGRLFKRGILVKTGDALERLAEITKVFFDKTGTLTLGRPALVNKDEIDAPVMQLAARLARSSRHPLSRAIADLAGPGPVAEDVVETPGFGLEGTIKGKTYRLGRPEWVKGGQAPNDNPGTVLGFAETAKGSKKVTIFLFTDAMRKDAPAVIGRLETLNLDVAMLSGDREQPAREAASKTGIQTYFAELTPQEKIDHVQAATKDGSKVLMVGDGLNDAPSLAAAHVSISPGSAADASQAAADIVFEGEELDAVLDALHIAKASKARILQNFGFAAVYNMLAVPLALAGMVTPMIAAIAMSGSSIIVTLNALRPFPGRRS